MKKGQQPESTPALPEEPVAEVGNELEVLQAQNEALADQVATLQEELEGERTARLKMQEQLDALQTSVKTTGSSVNLNPEPPAKPERPVVEIGEERYQFKSGSFRIGRDVVLATDVAANEERLYEVFTKYPGLFRKV